MLQRSPMRQQILASARDPKLGDEQLLQHLARLLPEPSALADIKSQRHAIDVIKASEALNPMVSTPGASFSLNPS
jgi:Tfp pilus assembly protein PilN